MLEQSDIKSIANAYEVLGLNVGASKEELEKRYTFLVRKNRALAHSEDENDKIEGEKALKAVTDAYNSIMEAELEAFRSQSQGKPNPVFKKMGVDERKARNIIHYYKYHFIFGLIGLIVLGYVIYGLVTKVEPDFNVTAIGAFYSQDTEPLKQDIKGSISDIKEPFVEVITIGGDANGQQEYAMQMKAMAVIAAGDIDVFVLDKDNFKKYAEGSAFASLDALAEELKVDKGKCYSAKSENPSEEHIYGFEVGNSKMLQCIQGKDSQRIVAISANTKNYEKAKKLLELLTK